MTQIMEEDKSEDELLVCESCSIVVNLMLEPDYGPMLIADCDTCNVLCCRACLDTEKIGRCVLCVGQECYDEEECEGDIEKKTEDMIQSWKDQMEGLDGPELQDVLEMIIKDQGVAFAEEHWEEELYSWCEHVSCTYHELMEMGEGEEYYPVYKHLKELVGEEYMNKIEDEEY